jgi:hypothetical protein
LQWRASTIAAGLGYVTPRVSVIDVSWWTRVRRALSGTVATSMGGMTKIFVLVYTLEMGWRKVTAVTLDLAKESAIVVAVAKRPH